MKNYITNLLILVSAMSALFPNQQQLNDEQIYQIQKEFFTIVWREAMYAKNITNEAIPHLREELLENLCSSAPNPYFSTHQEKQLSDSFQHLYNTDQ